MIKFTDLYINTVARGFCAPNEHIIAVTAGTPQSFWTFRLPFFRHDYLVIATSERLLVIDHRKGLLFDRMDAAQSYSWQEIGLLALKGVFTKRLVVKDAQQKVLLNAKLPKLFLSPVKNAGVAAEVAVQTWEQRRQLGALPSAPAYGMLPAQA